MAFTNKIFAYLRGNNDQFTDVKIVSSQQVWFKAHKFVLAAASPVFYQLFISDPECRVVFMDASTAGLKNFHRFIYFGKATLKKGNVDEVEAIAENLGVLPLMLALEEVKKKNRKLICRICGRIFKYRSHVKEHLATKHYKQDLMNTFAECFGDIKKVSIIFMFFFITNVLIFSVVYVVIS